MARANATGRLLRLDSRLPADLVQADCDGPFDPLADAGFLELWNACSSPQQERIALQFARHHALELRDAVLAVQDSALQESDGPAMPMEQARALALGRMLWRCWEGHRDQTLSRLHRDGGLLP